MNRGNYILMNGEYHDESRPYLFANRAFNYGDSIFESIRLINGVPYNLKSHIDRMMEGAKVIGLEIPVHFNEEYFASQIHNLAKKNGISSGGRARLTIFRSGDGTYFSENDKASFLLKLDYHPENLFSLNKEGLSMAIYNVMKKEKNILSKYKTGNSFLYIMAANYAKENNFDDCFVLNQNGKIIETISSNIFIVSNGVLYTPPLEDGCVGGTMRMKVINLALENGITVYESSLSPQNIVAANEIILTNAIRGVQWVGSYQSKRYFNTTSKKIIDLINQKEANLKLDLPEN